MFIFSVLFSIWFSPQHGHQNIHIMKDYIMNRPNMGLPTLNRLSLVNITPKMKSVDSDHAGEFLYTPCLCYSFLKVQFFSKFYKAKLEKSARNQKQNKKQDKDMCNPNWFTFEFRNPIQVYPYLLFVFPLFCMCLVSPFHG